MPPKSFIYRIQAIPVSSPGIRQRDMPANRVRRLHGVPYFVREEGNLKSLEQPLQTKTLDTLLSLAKKFPELVIDYRVCPDSKIHVQIYNYSLNLRTVKKPQQSV